MAKPLGPKSKLIREVISSNPNKGNTELAEMLNGAPARKTDKIKVTANDVAQQRQALKQLGGAKPAAANPSAEPAANGRKKPGRKPGKKPAAPASVKAAAASAQASPIDLIDRTLELAGQCGGVGALKRLVDKIAELQGR